MNISELAKFRGGVSVDTITELTSAAGVTIDGMLIKDGKTSSNNIANDGSAESPRGYAISTDANVAMTIANTRVSATATSANRTVTLPTTSVKAGMVVEVLTDCSGGYTIAINSSGANLIDTLKGTKGKISLMANQDAPTTAAHWRVVDVYDEGTWVPVSTPQTGSLSNDAYLAANFYRTGNTVRVNAAKTNCTNASVATYVRVSLPFPATTANGRQYVGNLGIMYNGVANSEGVGKAAMDTIVGTTFVEVRYGVKSIVSWVASETINWEFNFSYGI